MKNETVEAQINREIANTILAQLGGNKFLAMTGSHQLTYSSKERYLQMKLRRNASGAQYLKITLEPNDVYTMEFFKVKTKRESGFVVDYERVEVKKIEYVYEDGLQPLFTSITELRTHL